MPNFRYKAMTSSGDVVTGMLDANSKSAVIHQLQNLGQYPISAVHSSAGSSHGWLSADLWPARRASLRDLSIATQELSALLHAGLPLDRAVEILIGLGETRRLRGPFATALARLRDGASLTEAIGDAKTFSRFYVSMVHAGEMGGNLEGTLRHLAEYLSRAHATREAVVSALIYPAIVLVAACLSIMVILLFVLPEFEPLFESAGTSLPLATRIVIGIGRVVQEGWWILIAIEIMAALGLRMGLRRPKFRYRWDTATLRAPLFGDLITKIEMERFSQRWAFFWAAVSHCRRRSRSPKIPWEIASLPGPSAKPAQVSAKGKNFRANSRKRKYFHLSLWI